MVHEAVRKYLENAVNEVLINVRGINYIQISEYFIKLQQLYSTPLFALWVSGVVTNLNIQLSTLNMSRLSCSSALKHLENTCFCRAEVT